MNPDEILSNPEVDTVVRQARSEIRSRFDDYPLFLSRRINPPNVTGVYSISGQRIAPPPEVKLGSGNFTLSNQTADNYIDMNYDQVFQSAISSVGRIILRGDTSGNGGGTFTIYAIVTISDTSLGTTARSRNVLITDGIKDSQGLTGVYCVVPIENLTPDVWIPQAAFGIYAFDRNSVAKALVNESSLLDPTAVALSSPLKKSLSAMFH